MMSDARADRKGNGLLVVAGIGGLVALLLVVFKRPIVNRPGLGLNQKAELAGALYIVAAILGLTAFILFAIAAKKRWGSTHTDPLKKRDT